MFRFVDTSFKSEAYQLIEQGKLTTLEQLNQKFWAWDVSFSTTKGVTALPRLHLLFFLPKAIRKLSGYRLIL
jgi:hypothetical protein